jgi:inosose dehydratase
MIIGCFALVEPFASMERQFHAIREMGIEYADLTDNHDGASLGATYGFAASVSLDARPATVRKMAEGAGLTLTAFCAHANLLDPSSPDRYGAFQVIKAIRLANLLGIHHVITTESEPRTEFGQNLTPDEQLLLIREKLHTPILWAEELGVELLLETHGPVTDSVDRMAALLDVLGHEETVGICLDTGNSWLGGAEPIDYVKKFPKRIKHVHWKDMGPEWEEKRGTVFGCGMGTIPLGDGVIDLEAIIAALRDAGFDRATTLEVAGPDNVRLSVQRLKQWSGA